MISKLIISINYAKTGWPFGATPLWLLRGNMHTVKFFVGLLLGLFVSTSYAQAKEQIELTDLSGRKVKVSVPVDHVILGEGRFLPTLGILDRKDPTRRVVGMMGEFKKYDPASYAQYQKYFPGIDDIPLIGSNGSASFSLEKAVTIKPDVALFGLASGHGPSNKNKEILDKLKAAGVPVVIIDFRIDPLRNTPKSINILARLFGREKEAKEFLDFYRDGLGIVRERIKGITKRPTVFMESRVGLSPHCCEAVGNAMMGRFITWAGGKNVFGDLIPGTHGTVNVEHLLVEQPDFYIGTAIGSLMTGKKFPKFIALGAGTDKSTASLSLKRSMKRTGLAQLSAITSGRAYSIWHHFYNSPMNVVAVQVIAKWLHPDLFEDLNPEKTLAEYFDRFQPFPLNGVYWTGLTKNRGS